MATMTTSTGASAHTHTHKLCLCVFTLIFASTGITKADAIACNGTQLQGAATCTKGFAEGMKCEETFAEAGPGVYVQCGIVDGSCLSAGPFCEAEGPTCTYLVGFPKEEGKAWAEVLKEIPSAATFIKVTMGDVVDYFKPVTGATLPQMIQSNNKHQFSTDGSTWVTPEFNPTPHWGGSAANWPANNLKDDARYQLSGWYKDNWAHGEVICPGCCSDSKDAEKTGSWWSRDWAMYTCS